MQRVICPSPQSVGAVGLPVWNPTQQAGEIEEAIRATVGRAGSAREAVEHYYKRYGYLPLVPSLSVPRVVALWLEQRGSPDGVWAEVWNWANDPADPLKQYHASLVFLAHPELVPDTSHGELWAKVAAIAGLGAARDGQRSRDTRWRLNCELARHYCQYLESLWPGSDGEAIASFAWWMSREVASSIPTEAVAYMAEKILPPVILASRNEHRFCAPHHERIVASVRHVVLRVDLVDIDRVPPRCERGQIRSRRYCRHRPNRNYRRTCGRSYGWLSASRL